MSELHCLYCDRPLALMHRLTGDKEFCSKEHRRIYQEQHSQLALARLLQAQPGPKEPPPLKDKGKPAPVRGRPEPQPTVQVRHVPQPREAELSKAPSPPARPREAAPAATSRERTAIITPEPAAPPRPAPPRAEPPRPEAPRPEPQRADPAAREAARDVKPVTVRPAPPRVEAPPVRETPRAAPPSPPPTPPEPVPSLARFRPLTIELKSYPAMLRFPETRRFALPIARSIKPRAKASTVFLTPSAFVRRRIQPATPEWAKGSTFRLRAAAFPHNEPQLSYLEDRLTGSDRIGFCPP